MSDTRHDDLYADLVADLRPVRRLGPPLRRAAGWIAFVVAIAAVLAWFADMPAVAHRLMAAPDMWLAVLGSAMTTGLAAVAAFELGMPDRSPRWSLLPLPGLALWVGASGMGCARSWLIPGTIENSMGESMHCLRFILLLSIPLSVAIFWGLRRGYSMYPSLTAATAGLAVAGAAATLLMFFHPFDTTVTDLSVHLCAVLVVVLVNQAIGAALFARKVLRTRR